MGKIKLTLIDMRSGSPITVEADPNMSADELVNMLRERGKVQSAEAVTFGKVTESGTLEPLSVATVGDLFSAQMSGAQIGFEARRVQGSSCSQNLKKVAKRLGLKFQGEWAYGYFKWRGGDEIYMIFIRCEEIASAPPEIIICPYPYYVKIYSRFEENHARSCCWQRTIGDTICGYWHIDNNEYEKLREEVGNPTAAMYHVLNSVMQALELHRVWGL